MLKKFLLMNLMIGFGLILLTGCNKKEEKVGFIDDYGYATPEEVTYKFFGVSEHFAFCTGKVYYGNDNEKYLYLDNFKIINELFNEKEVSSYSINVLFDNKELFTDEQTPIARGALQSRLDNFGVEEGGIYSTDGKEKQMPFVKLQRKVSKMISK